MWRVSDLCRAIFVVDRDSRSPALPLPPLSLFMFWAVGKMPCLRGLTYIGIPHRLVATPWFCRKKVRGILNHDVAQIDVWLAAQHASQTQATETGGWRKVSPPCSKIKLPKHAS